MTGLGWTRNGEMVALGWTLLHFCWQGTALALLYAVADRATRHSAMKVRYGLAMVVLTLMPLVAFGTFVEQARLVIVAPQSEFGEFPARTFASELGAFHGTIVQGIPGAAPVMESGELWIATRADKLLPWVDTIWLGGVLLLALRALGGWWSLEGVRKRAVGSMPVEVQVSFERVCRKLRMGRRVVLRVSDEVISPLAMGVWRTAVILPASALLRLEREQLEAVLAHELAHVRRWDYVCNLIQTGIECLLFFHPAVWWVSHRTRDLREVCCDEVAARSCADPVVYAEALLKLEEGRQMPMAMALHGANGRSNERTSGTLLTRVKKILGEGITMESKTVSGMRVAVAGAVMMGLLVAPKVAKGIESLPTLTGMAAVIPEMRKTTTQTTPVMLAEAARPLVVAPVVTVAAPAPAAAPAPMPMPEPTAADGDQAEVKTSGADYIDGMKKAGYPLDLNKDLDSLISLRSVGVTPEYAKGMAQAGMGTPSLHDLVALKSVGVTPEYLAGLHGSGIAPESFHDAIGEKSLGITPEYAKGIAALGIGTPTVHDLMGLKAQGVTPEYVASMKAAGIPLTSLHEIASVKALGVTPEYAQGMEASGFGKLSAHELVSLKAQGASPEYVSWLKKTFPEADMHQVQRASVFHIDEAFVAKAKGHGFNELTLDKLVRLKTSGLLD